MSNQLTLFMGYDILLNFTLGLRFAPGADASNGSYRGRGGDSVRDGGGGKCAAFVASTT